MKCFVLDDSPVFCRRIRSLLKRGYAEKVHVETDYDAAYNSLKVFYDADDIPDIIFVDFDLREERTGVDFIESAKSQNNLSTYVLVTDTDDYPSIEAAQKMGALHIPKSGLDDVSLQQVSLHAISKLTSQLSLARKQVKQQRNSIFSLSAEIAHELKHSNNLIKQTIDELVCRAEEQSFSNSVEDLTEDIYSVADESDHMCKLLLNYGLISKLKLSPVRSNLGDFLQEIINPKLKVSIIAEDEFGKIDFFFDAMTAKTIFKNLMENIVIHCGDGTEVEVRCKLINVQDIDFLSIIVSDKGPGIPEQYQLAIFDAGERAGKEPDYNDGGGLGLGLAFARELARSFEYRNSLGEITLLYSSQKDGTSFSVILPGHAF